MGVILVDIICLVHEYGHRLWPIRTTVPMGLNGVKILLYHHKGSATSCVRCLLKPGSSGGVGKVLHSSMLSTPKAPSLRTIDFSKVIVSGTTFRLTLQSIHRFV